MNINFAGFVDRTYSLSTLASKNSADSHNVLNIVNAFQSTINSKNASSSNMDTVSFSGNISKQIKNMAEERNPNIMAAKLEEAEEAKKNKKPNDMQALFTELAAGQEPTKARQTTINSGFGKYLNTASASIAKDTDYINIMHELVKRASSEEYTAHDKLEIQKEIGRYNSLIDTIAEGVIDTAKEADPESNTIFIRSESLELSNINVTTKGGVEEAMKRVKHALSITKEMSRVVGIKMDDLEKNKFHQSQKEVSADMTNEVSKVTDINTLKKELTVRGLSQTIDDYLKYMGNKFFNDNVITYSARSLQDSGVKTPIGTPIHTTTLGTIS